MLNYFLRLRFITALMGILLVAGYSQNANALIWNMPIITFDSSQQSFDLAVDPNGNAFTVWVDSPDVFSSRFSAVTQTYGPATTINDPLTDTSPFNVLAATDATSTALFLWYDQVTFEGLTSYFNGTTYVTPTPSPLFTFSSGNIAETALAMNGLGDGLAAWVITPFLGTSDVNVSFFDGGTQTWGTVQIITPLGFSGSDPQVAFSPSGNAVAVWNDASGNVVASNYNGTSWSVTPIVIGPTGTEIKVHMDAAGNALVLWTDSGTSELFSSYFNGTVWSAPISVSLGDAVLFDNYDFAMAPGGSAIAVYEGAGDAGFYSLFSPTAWTAPIQFNPDVFTLSVAVDSSGNALIVYGDSGSGNLMSISKPFGGALGTPDLVDPATTLDFVLAGLADNGRGFTTGAIPGGETAGVGGTFSFLPIPPINPPDPPVISGTVCSDKFASQTDRVHIITFTPSPTPTVTSYELFRNGVLIAVIPATGPFVYFDHNRCRKVADVYTLVAVAPSGISTPVVVILR